VKDARDMKTFLISLRDETKVPIQADSFMEVDGRHCFFRAGEAVAFSYFESSEVIGISEIPPYEDVVVSG
jgi:hypothetical protein